MNFSPGGAKIIPEKLPIFNVAGYRVDFSNAKVHVPRWVVALEARWEVALEAASLRGTGYKTFCICPEYLHWLLLC